MTTPPSPAESPSPAGRVSIEQVETRRRDHVRGFIDLPYRLYAGHPLWVPPLRMDVELQLNRDKHPYYRHSDADFFVARRDGRIVGRIAVLENKRYNSTHDVRTAQFYLFECEDDFAAATALFERAFEWARRRGLDTLVGPKGFAPLDGYGFLVDGFEFRPAMTMMNYNPPRYPDFVERLGFTKVVDFVSCYLGARQFRLPERVHRIAGRAAERSGLRVVRFRSKKELRAWADRIGQAYNRAFVENWEYYPLTDEEIRFVTDSVLSVADPRLIKIIARGDEAVGFLFAFRDVSAALQRCRGRLLPLGIVHLLLDMRRTDWVAINGAGILPEFQGRGGNALLYSEMEKTIREAGFRHADLTQVAESAVQMRRDLETVGGVSYKNHRVYQRKL
jgi:GNAT superfamily N-acetyltransferase